MQLAPKFGYENQKVNMKDINFSAQFEMNSNLL